MTPNGQMEPADDPRLLRGLISHRVLVLSNTLALAAGRFYPHAFGVRLAEWRVIDALHAGRGITANQVSQWLKTDKAWVSRSVQRLVSAGLARRRRDPGDGRRMLLTLTPKGERTYRAIAAAARLEHDFHEAHPRGEPRPSRRTVRPLEPRTYRKRVWATRKNLWVDRMASAWLIRRFIDRDARFVWLDHPRQRPKKAIGFDFDGAQFTHVDGQVSFEVLMGSFGLERDPALAAIARSVHYLDVGGIAVPDAKGLETMLKGAREKAKNDDALLADATRVFDLLYSAYS